nr:cell division protein ZapA [Desulfobulbaceae bacterium]
MERLVTFEVLGQEYPLHTDAPEEDVREILDLVRNQIEHHSKSAKMLPAKVAVLVSLNMAGKYVKLKRDLEKLRVQENHEIDRIVNQIESSL